MSLYHRAPTRYFSERVEMGWMEALARFLKTREWSWERIQFRAVYKGQPGYEEAPFEETFVPITGVYIIPNNASR